MRAAVVRVRPIAMRPRPLPDGQSAADRSRVEADDLANA